MDAVLMFGFVTGFFTVVALLYRRELRTGFPVLAVSIGASAVYGFMQGAWPLGFILLTMTSLEFLSWWRVPATPVQPRAAIPRLTQVSLCDRDARISRMFEQR
jgi:TRAP-type C4-dicarboxylate transport system permease small subunit